MKITSDLKKHIKARCEEIINYRILELKRSLDDLNNSQEGIKSSAGDKHETTRAMLETEKENLSRQLHQALGQSDLILKIANRDHPREAQTGSLVKTTRGVFYLSVPLGKVVVDNTEVVVLSPSSPLGSKLQGLKKGDTAEFNGDRFEILEVA